MGKGAKFSARDVARIICEAKRDSGATERQIIDLCPCWQDPSPTSGRELPRVSGSTLAIDVYEFVALAYPYTQCSMVAWRFNDSQSMSDNKIPMPQDTYFSAYGSGGSATTQCGLGQHQILARYSELWRGDGTPLGYNYGGWQDGSKRPNTIVFTAPRVAFAYFGIRATGTSGPPTDFELRRNGKVIVRASGVSWTPAGSTQNKWWAVS
jgi:hypothetical protein